MAWALVRRAVYIVSKVALYIVIRQIHDYIVLSFQMWLPLPVEQPNHFASADFAAAAVATTPRKFGHRGSPLKAAGHRWPCPEPVATCARVEQRRACVLQRESRGERVGENFGDVDGCRKTAPFVAHGTKCQCRSLVFGSEEEEIRGVWKKRERRINTDE